jgi:mannosyltransferase OCH1-like enzyme
MQQLSIASFLANGHAYHLYVYEDLKGIPAGTVVKDGNDILPASRIFQYRDYPTYAGFANYFRFKLLFDRGGWWADLDLICLKPFDFPEEYVVSSERAGQTRLPNCGALKAPPGSDPMRYAWEVCDSKDPALIAWGETGPKLTAEAVRACALDRFVQAPEVFCPLDFGEWARLITPGLDLRFGEATYGVHLWNEMWRRAGVGTTGHPPDSFYGQLQRRYLGG